MLEPREADLHVLLLVLVVLPLVIYILLGKWSETPKQKTRISMLAQLAAEEALRVAEIASVNVTPHVPPSKITFRECAMCFAPATTRCSKCKSVRYCSGKCQIMHWRQGHKQDCHQLASNRVLFSTSDSLESKPFIENSKQKSGNVIEETLHSDSLFDVSTDGSLLSDTSYDMTSERKLSDFGNKSGGGNFTSSSEVSKCEDSTSPTYGHAPTTLINVIDEPHKVTGERNNMLKPRFASHNSENESNEHKIGSIFTPEASDEALDLNFSVEDAPIRGSLMYKRPPYILGPTTLTQKTAEKIPRNLQCALATSVPTSSRKSSKIHKWNLRGFTNGCSKNKMLFPYEDIVKFYQCEVWGISPRGLLNCGNSCYANAVLQCLTCTKPLLIYLLRRSHSKTCRASGWCLMCELEQHVSLLREGGGPLSPSRILSNMRNIGCRMGGGDQEDAHEFLRHLVMSMQSICLDGLGGEKEVNPRLQETTLIQQIFGGRLKSKVKCLRCHLESERYENIMDLTLEIHGWVESLEDALTQFTAAEDLDGENMYRCGRCAAYVRARKQLSVHQVPNILTIVLKRFQTGKYGKINKCVTFPDMLDMIPYVTGTADSPPLYTLFGVVVHLDTLNASFSGHYVSYVKDLQGTWFRIDDSEVQAVLTSEVMSEGAYMLFYSRSFPRPPRAYIEKASKTSRHRVNSSRETNIPPKDKGTSSDSFSMDFSDAMSSDLSLFTSSDESSSFTTESAKDSFSTIDHSDPVSSIFAPPFYSHEYPQSNTTTCKNFSPCGLETRFFSERRGFVVDSSLLACSSGNGHKGRNSNHCQFRSYK